MEQFRDSRKVDWIKRELLSHELERQKEAVASLTEQVKTYLSKKRKRLTGATLPKAFLQVDMVSAVAQAMATTDVGLFKLLLELTRSLFKIPALRERLMAVVESGLRVAAIIMKSDYAAVASARAVFETLLRESNREVISPSVQKQILMLYEKLPQTLDPEDVLEWTRLLLYCSNGSLVYQLREFYDTAIEFLKIHADLPSLKIVLTLSHLITLSKSQRSDSCDSSTQDTNSEVPDDQAIRMMRLMECNCTLLVKILIHDCNTGDVGLVKALLQLFLTFPVHSLTPPTNRIRSTRHSNSIEDDYESRGWTAGLLMRALLWVRSNQELTNDTGILEVWSSVMARILIFKFPDHVSTLPIIWSEGPWSLHTGGREDQIQYAQQLLQTLDPDIWTMLMESGVTYATHPKYSQNIQAALLVYYFYAVFNFDDPDAYFDHSFIRVLKKIIRQSLQNSSKDRTCFYFRVCLMIKSCTPDFCDISFNNLLLEILSTWEVELEDLVVLCAPVIFKVSSWNALSLKESVSLMDSWALKNPEEFRNYFLTADANSDVLKGQIIDIVGLGSQLSSNHLLEIINHRKIRFDTDAQRITAIERLLTLLDVMEEDDSTLNYDNLLRVVLADQSFFTCTSLESFPVDVYSKFIGVISQQRNSETLRLTFAFIVNCCKKLRHGLVLTLVTSHPELLEFCSHLISQSISDCNVKSFVHAYEMILVYYNSSVECEEEDHPPKLKWSMKVVPRCLQHHAVWDTILKLVTGLLRKDFKQKAIDIAELSTGNLEETLFAIQFAVLSAFNKMVFVDSQILAFEFLTELFLFSTRRAGKMLQSYHLAANPWLLIAFIAFVPPGKPLTQLPIQFLNFLLIWVQFLQREDNRLFRVLPVSYQSLNFASFFKDLHRRIGEEINGGGAQQQPMMNSSFVSISEDMFPDEERRKEDIIEEKTIVLGEIWKVLCAVEDGSVEWSDRLSQVTINESHASEPPSSSGSTPMILSSDSETGSEADFQ